MVAEMEEIQTIRFVDLGSSLGTRILASKIRQQILENIDQKDKVIFDFDGVEVVTNSFANECFAKMLHIISADTFREKFAFVNANDFIQRVIISSFHS